MLDVFEEIAEMRARGERGVLCTVVSTSGSTPGKETMRLLLRESGSFTGSVGGGCVEADVLAAAREVLETERARKLEFRLTEEATGTTGLMCGGLLEVFVEPVAAPHAILFGAGHVSRSICAIAADAGFRVTVADDRPTFATAERFPQARAVVSAESWSEVFSRLSIPATAACVVVTRGHTMDLECLDFALHTPAAYVGLIGSKVKVRGILSRLRDRGRLVGVDLARLHAPIGLAIGGGTHGEIAVSIVAELIAHRRRRLEGLAQMRLPADEVARIAARRRVGRDADPSKATPAGDRGERLPRSSPAAGDESEEFEPAGFGVRWSPRPRSLRRPGDPMPRRRGRRRAHHARTSGSG